MRTVPALRAAYDQALTRASSGKGLASLKATVAAEAVEDETLKARLQNLQEQKIVQSVGIEGNWLVLGDKSGSMTNCIDAARHVAATLSKFVKGKVHLIFFDGVPMYVDVTGLSYENILKATVHISAGGQGTSIGCGLQRLIDNSIEVDGIAIVSDAQENTAPRFTDIYPRYCKMVDKNPPVYLYRFAPNQKGYSDTDLAESMKRASIELAEFDLRGGVDYFSLPNLVKTMRANRYSLLDEIMNTKLLTLDAVLPLRKGEQVYA